MKNPTIEMTETLQKAYDYFNSELFHDELPQCMITLNRKRTARGYFSQDRFSDRQSSELRYHEIALNPDTFSDRSDKQILSTLVHEMVHCWQAEWGLNKTKNGYHNQEWVGKMQVVGLKAWSETTGERGTGTKVTHDIIPFGLFDSSCDRFLRMGNSINYQSVKASEKESRPRKKYTYTFVCPKCGDYAKSHKNRNIVCGDCLEMMELKGDE